MYHTIVARRTSRIFDALNRGDLGPLLDGIAPGALHVMNGEHALSGARQHADSIRSWYDRLLRLLPGLRFSVDSIIASGPPWDTTVLVQWRDSALDGTYANRGVNVVELRWGRIRAIRIHCDSQLLSDRLAQLADAGVAEAAQAPIVDPVGREPWARAG